MAAGVLTIRLGHRCFRRNTEGENGRPIPVQAFAEEGRVAMNPGPLIRVIVGTRLHVSLHNLLASQAVTIYGLNAHNGESNPVIVPPLGNSDVEFQAVRPGIYFYW